MGGHLASPRHAGAARARALDTTLQLLPLPSPPHLAGIAALLATLDREETLTPGDLAAREEVRRLLEELIARDFPGYRGVAGGRAKSRIVLGCLDCASRYSRIALWFRLSAVLAANRAFT